MTLKQEILAVQKLKRKAADLKATADAAKLLADQAERDLWDHMDAEEVSSMKINGTNHVAVSTIYGTVADKAALREWAVDEGNAPELFEPAPRKALINELVRQRIDNGESLPPGINFYAKQYVAARGGKDVE